MTAALILAVTLPPATATAATAAAVWAARRGVLTVRLTRPTPRKDQP